MWNKLEVLEKEQKLLENKNFRNNQNYILGNYEKYKYFEKNSENFLTILLWKLFYYTLICLIPLIIIVKYLDFLSEFLFYCGFLIFLIIFDFLYNQFLKLTFEIEYNYMDKKFNWD